MGCEWVGGGGGGGQSVGQSVSGWSESDRCLHRVTLCNADKPSSTLRLVDPSYERALSVNGSTRT
jgi:hypothetical protein